MITDSAIQIESRLISTATPEILPPASSTATTTSSDTASTAPATVTVEVITRHSAGCEKSEKCGISKCAGGLRCKHCRCRKSLYIYDGKKVKYVSAKTRSWEEAEKFAEEQRSLRITDPVKRELAELKAEKATQSKIAATTIVDAVALWIKETRSDKAAPNTMALYRIFERKLNRWAERQGITLLSEVTPLLLAQWKAAWGPDAEHEDDRIGQSSQLHYSIKVKSFFAWAFKMDLVRKNPAAQLTRVKASEKRTNVLTREQFAELIKATESFDEYGKELRALFLLQRWTGLRIGDCLMLPRSAVSGSRIKLTTQKTGTKFEAVLPDVVVKALAALATDRQGFRSDSFFRQNNIRPENLNTIWIRIIKRFAQTLNFTNEDPQSEDFGKPMKFHSHMLRDTFAVEMLMAGVALEDVSRLLTHKNVKITETYYAHWTKARREQLENKSIAAMRAMGATVSL